MGRSVFGDGGWGYTEWVAEDVFYEDNIWVAMGSGVDPERIWACTSDTACLQQTLKIQESKWTWCQPQWW